MCHQSVNVRQRAVAGWALRRVGVRAGAGTSLRQPCAQVCTRATWGGWFLPRGFHASRR